MAGWGFTSRDVGAHFHVVAALPTSTLVVCASFVWVSGGFSGVASLDNVRDFAASLDVVEAVAFAIVVVLVSLLLYPFHTQLIKVLEGYWPVSGPFALLYELGRHRQRRVRERLDFARTSDADEESNRTKWQRFWDAAVEDVELRKLREKEAAHTRLLRMPLDQGDPASDRLMPTRLGNTLRHFEDLAGERRYGMDAVRVVPYLLAVARSEFVSYVDDARTDLDIAASFTWTWLIVTIVSLSAYIDSGVWMVVPLATIVFAWASYHAAVSSADSYGEMLVALVDLYRFDLYQQLHEGLPENLDEELQLNERLDRLQSGHPNAEDRSTSYYHSIPSSFDTGASAGAETAADE